MDSIPQNEFSEAYFSAVEQSPPHPEPPLTKSQEWMLFDAELARRFGIPRFVRREPWHPPVSEPSATEIDQH